MALQAKSNGTLSEAHREHAIELFIGNLLRVCVIATVAVVLLGAVLLLPSVFSTVAAYTHFASEPGPLRSVGGIITAALQGDGAAIVQSGLLLLILTPILRVAFSVFAFLYERDYLYVVLTLVVLGLLMYSLFAG